MTRHNVPPPPEQDAFFAWVYSQLELQERFNDEPQPTEEQEAHGVHQSNS